MTGPVVPSNEDELREALAEALAERFTSEHGDRNPAWDWEQPDGPDNAYHLTVPMDERRQRTVAIIFTDTDGCRSIRIPTCEELADALLPVVRPHANQRALTAREEAS